MLPSAENCVKLILENVSLTFASVFLKILLSCFNSDIFSNLFLALLLLLKLLFILNSFNLLNIMVILYLMFNC